MGKIILKEIKILTMLNDQISTGDVLIDGDTIVAVGEVNPALWQDGAVEIIDGQNTLVMPGLVNTHCHGAMTLLRSYADDMSLMPWLNEMIWPAEAKLTDEHVYWGAQLAILEMIKSGTTTFADMYDHMDQVAQAVAETGIRANLCRGIVSFGDEHCAKIAENAALYEKWDHSCDGRIVVWFGPHAAYTCPPDYLEKIVQAARDHKTGLHVHVAETLAEIKDIQEMYQKTPVAYLNDLGVFDGPALAAHCVHLTEEDMAILVAKKVGIAHNPVSNLKLASGIAPISQLQKMGGIIGLGTDGASSNNSQNLFKEINQCALIHKVQTMDPTAMGAYEALKLATIGGAKALHWDEQIGTIEVGKKADLILIDLNKPHYAPYNNLVSDLAYSAQGSDVKTTIVNGKILMKDYQMIDMDSEKIMKEATRCAKMITN